ncbi:ABC transporter permease [Membranicola marinus]|uniref:ABC transporter permease n=1 Tax=Membranihabitans marinus TaxID=1227546 RepID=A0A953I2M6_9BACT|nr:ABC transporter permease [Membranihabitans marinus]MBY5960107.1 ABC transporter permease [Membranihabitans marinus]
MKAYISLLRTEWYRDYKDLTSWMATLQYLLASTFIIYLIFRDMAGQLWLSMFWVIAIFSLINASVTAFKDTFTHDFVWFYQLYAPEVILLSKMVISFLKNLILLLVLWGLMILFFGQAIRIPGGFFVSLVLAALNFSAISHLVNAIAHRTDRSQSLYPVLSLPLIIPVVLELYNIGAIAIGLNPAANNWWSDASILTGLGLIFTVGAVVLFPYVWKD